MADLPETKPDSDEFIIHWAQWFNITYWRLFNAPVGTNERRRAFMLHDQAQKNLIHSVGIANNEVPHV
jgi:hypothetical protein